MTTLKFIQHVSFLPLIYLMAKTFAHGKFMTNCVGKFY